MSLEEHRKQASFDIEGLKVAIDEEDGVELKQYIWEKLNEDPIFHEPLGELTIDQEQELTFRRVKRLAEYDIEYFVSPAKQAAFLSALSAFDCSLPVLHGVNAIVSFAHHGCIVEGVYKGGGGCSNRCCVHSCDRGQDV